MEEQGRPREVEVLRRQPGESKEDFWLRCRRAVEEAKQRHPSAPRRSRDAEVAPT